MIRIYMEIDHHLIFFCLTLVQDNPIFEFPYSLSNSVKGIIYHFIIKYNQDMLIYVIQYLVHYTFTCNKNGRQGISQGMVNFSLHYIYKNGGKRSRAI